MYQRVGCFWQTVSAPAVKHCLPEEETVIFYYSLLETAAFRYVCIMVKTPLKMPFFYRFLQNSALLLTIENYMI